MIWVRCVKRHYRKNLVILKFFLGQYCKFWFNFQIWYLEPRNYNDSPCLNLFSSLANLYTFLTSWYFNSIIFILMNLITWAHLCICSASDAITAFTLSSISACKYCTASSSLKSSRNLSWTCTHEFEWINWWTNERMNEWIKWMNEWIG